MFDWWKKLLQRKVLLGATAGAALVFMVFGIIFWGGFNTAMEATNNLAFCISCHEMENNVYQEYVHTKHYKNSTGVRAVCPDCHVPREWQHMVVRKITASRELFLKLAGTVDTAEKFQQNRLRMAQSVWQSMASTDSRECRNCHSFAAMDLGAQQGRSGLMHAYAQDVGKTCISCHQGITHKLPAGTVAYRGGSDEDHDYFEAHDLACYRCHEDMPEPNNDEWDDLDGT